jgi:uncharacterized protein (DUF1800 family)
MPMGSAAEIPTDLRAVHTLNRLAYGPRPGDLQRVKSIGVDRYIQQQLSPDSIPIPPSLSDRLSELETIRMTPPELFVKYGKAELRAANKGAKLDPEMKKEARRRAQLVVQQAVAAHLMLALESPRQLQEVMVDFWFNHFNVFAAKGLDHLWVGSYENRAIRPHALGRFRDLLEATAKHPAMLFYLDNWQNTAPNSPGARGKFEGLNENYARELMELHTLGVNGGYSQQDVIALARILTGWGIQKPRVRKAMASGGGAMGGPGLFAGLRVFGMHPFGLAPRRRATRNADGGGPDEYGFYFDSSRHDFSDKTFLGHHIQGAGAVEVEQALDILARNPATARHVSYQLAQFFVADNPPDPLVRRMSDRFLATDGNIRAVLNSLFQSGEFWDRSCYAAKFKTPQQYLISAARASGIEVVNYRLLAGTAQRLGMPLYGCQTPDGYKNTQEAWLNPDAMMIRLSLATALGMGHLPLDRAPADNDGGGGKARVTRAIFRAGSADARGAPPLDPSSLRATLGNYFSAHTNDAIEAAPSQLQAALLLGSPEFMHR